MDFSDFLKPYLNKKTKYYYVALSGGADSLVLLNELKKLHKDNDFNLIAIHINHNIQKDSKKISIRFTDRVNRIQRHCDQIQKN